MVNAFTSPRAWAFTLLGIHEYLRRFPGSPEMDTSCVELPAKLVTLWHGNAAEDLPWFEDSLSYDNARLSQALILSGQRTAHDEAFRATGDAAWSEAAKRAFEWFLGRNDLGVPLYDSMTGGCSDGLHVDRVSENQGAESTLAFHLALTEMLGAQQLITEPSPHHPGATQV